MPDRASPSATLLLNSAAAIVIYFVYSFVLPGLFELGAQLIDWFDDIAALDRLRRRPDPAHRAATSTGEEWAHLRCRALIWLVLPLALGALAVLRAEVK